MIENPVLIQEIKTKMRGRQSREVLIAVASVLVLFILWCYYQAFSYMMRYSSGATGKDAWEIGIVLQGLLIWLLAPAVTANAISQEREQQTWEMLLFTLLTPREIVVGKLLARLVPIAALMLAFFPFMVFCFLRSTLGFAAFVATYLVL